MPGYPGAKAKLLVFRARKQFKSGRDRFRLGGILVKSRHAIHEATLFNRGLEWDSNALWFHGRLTCEAIDDLWNEYDERQARGEPHPPENPVPILDPSRKSGLTPGHPFVDALDGQEGVLRAVWSVKALEATPATGLAVRVGPIEAESTIAVLASEADRYGDLETLKFERPRYRIRGGSRRRIRLLAPKELVRSAGADFDLTLSSDGFRVSGTRQLRLKPSLGIAVARLAVRVLDDDASPAQLVARLGDEEAETEVRAAQEAGVGIVIRLEDVDYGALRYCWNGNVLEIGARHPSLQRYLGSKSESYPGQDHLHFRVLLAEVVAEALCARRLEGNIKANPADFAGMSWDDYYRHFAELMSRFLPNAHQLMAPET